MDNCDTLSLSFGLHKQAGGVWCGGGGRIIIIRGPYSNADNHVIICVYTRFSVTHEIKSSSSRSSSSRRRPITWPWRMSKLEMHRLLCYYIMARQECNAGRHLLQIQLNPMISWALGLWGFCTVQGANIVASLCSHCTFSTPLPIPIPSTAYI